MTLDSSTNSWPLLIFLRLLTSPIEVFSSLLTKIIDTDEKLPSSVLLIKANLDLPPHSGGMIREVLPHSSRSLLVDLGLSLVSSGIEWNGRESSRLVASLSDALIGQILKGRRESTNPIPQQSPGEKSNEVRIEEE